VRLRQAVLEELQQVVILTFQAVTVLEEREMLMVVLLSLV
jgi:hypothetical protein